MTLKKSQKDWVGLRGMLPVLSAFILMLFVYLPFHIPLVESFIPHLTLIAIYYWSVFRPDLMPVWAVFVIGVLQDVISGGPLGMTALLLIFVRQLVTLQGRKFLERDFLFNWLIFSFIAAAFGVSAWILASFYLGTSSLFFSILGQTFLTIAIFPLLYWILGGIRKRLW